MLAANLPRVRGFCFYGHKPLCIVLKWWMCFFCCMLEGTRGSESLVSAKRKFPFSWPELTIDSYMDCSELWHSWGYGIVTLWKGSHEGQTMVKDAQLLVKGLFPFALWLQHSWFPRRNRRKAWSPSSLSSKAALIVTTRWCGQGVQEPSAKWCSFWLNLLVFY